MISGLPRKTVITSEEIRQCLQEPISAIAETVVSKSTRRAVGISLVAIMYPVHALMAPNAHRSMQGT